MRIVTCVLALLLFAARVDASFAYYKTFRTTASQAGPADSSNYPLAVAPDGHVQSADVDFKQTGSGGCSQDANGYDIRPYTDVGLTSAMTYQLVWYDSSTGAFEMHVLVSTLDHTTNQTFYMACGDVALNTDGSSTSTWNSTFKAVYHAQDNAANTTVKDWSQNTGTNDATNAANTSTKTTTSGEIGRGLTYNGSSDKSTAPSIAAINNVTNVSFSVWVNLTASVDFMGVFVKSISTALERFGVIMGGSGFGNNLGLGMVYGGGASSFFATTTSGSLVSTGTWFHVAATWDGSQATNTTRAILYLNGASQTLSYFTGSTPSGAIANSTDGAQIGADRSNTFLNGIEDEARIYAGTYTPSWVTSDYNSQKPSSTFLVWGSLTPTTAATASRLPLSGVGK